MATRTAKGTAKTKASGTTLTLASVACSDGDSLFVGLGFQGTTPPATVKWGGRQLSKVGQRLHSTPAFGCAVYQARRIINTDTRDIVATWASALDAKVLLALTLDTPHVKDEIIRAVQTGSTAPSVGPLAEMDRSDEFALGILCSEGPQNNDTPPTLAGGWTAGQRIGTNGPPPVSNVTILEGYQQLTSSPGVTLSGTGATSRDWCSVLIGFRPVIMTATDKFGSTIMVGDTVVYGGSTYTVNALRRGQNHVELTGFGWVSASEVEVMN